MITSGYQRFGLTANVKEMLVTWTFLKVNEVLRDGSYYALICRHFDNVSLMKI